jgi:hypothetical protein
MIDRQYGRLLRDGCENAIKLPDALKARWTLGGRRKRKTASSPKTTARTSRLNSEAL